MNFLGNIIWLVFGGILGAIAWFIAGLLLCITIIGIPFGVQCFKIAGFVLWPFGRDVEIGNFWRRRVDFQHPLDYPAGLGACCNPCGDWCPVLHHHTGNSIWNAAFQTFYVRIGSFWSQNILVHCLPYFLTLSHYGGKMRKSTITAAFQADIKTVWNFVTDNENYLWRSDLSKIEVIGNGNTFIEHTKEGYQTQFHITAKEPYSRYEFDMENKNFSGHWIGIFTALENGGTKICFAEELNIKNPAMEILSYLFMNLKKIQEQYVNDLRKALNE